MNLNGVKVVKLGDLEFYLRYSNRALLEYLNKSSKEPDNIEIVIRYYYDLAKSGARSEKKQFDYSFDEFFDAIDPFPDALQKFNDAITDLLGSSDESKKKLKE